MKDSSIFGEVGYPVFRLVLVVGTASFTAQVLCFFATGTDTSLGLTTNHCYSTFMFLILIETTVEAISCRMFRIFIGSFGTFINEIRAFMIDLKKANNEGHIL